LGVLQFLSWLRLLASYSSLGYTLWSVASTGDCIIGLILSRLIIFIVHFSFCVVSKLMMPRTKFAFSIFFCVCYSGLDNLFLKRKNEKDVSNRIFEINQIGCQAEAKAQSIARNSN
jgi:hypothetical protein